jgi:hypothetical protein
MGQARKLSMGYEGPRRRRPPAAPAGQRESRAAVQADMRALQKLTAAPRPDMETYASILDRTAHLAGNSIYDDALKRFTQLKSDL